MERPRPDDEMDGALQRSGAAALPRDGGASAQPRDGDAAALPEDRRAAARVLHLAGTLPGLALTGWLLATTPLLLLREGVAAYRPWIAGPLGLAGAALLVIPGVRDARRPAYPAAARPAAGPAIVGAARYAAVPRVARLAWAPVAAVLLVAAAFGALAVGTSGEHVLLRRDAGSYAHAAHLLATEGRPLQDVDLAALGGADPGLALASPGFFAHGDDVVPQFLPGQPAILAACAWLGGWRAVLTATAVLGALALVAVGALARSLLGPWAAVFTVAGTAAAFPVLHVARAPYSEPLALLLLAAGLSLLYDATARPARASTDSLDRRTAVAGLVLGAGCLVRLDALTAVALLVPYAGWLWHRDRPRGVGLTAGLAGSTAGAAVVAVVLNRDYLRINSVSVRPLVALSAVTVLATVAGVLVASRRAGGATRAIPVGRRPGGRLRHRATWAAPWAGLAMLLIGAGLAARPLFSTARKPAALALAVTMEGRQRREGLAVDPTRTYEEHSVTWLGWWLGVPLLVVALGGAALLTVRLLRGRDAAWWPTALAGVGGTLLVLARPGITPDHPWADRRLVPVALWVTVLLGAYGLTWLTRLVPAVPRLRGRVRTTAVAVVAAGLLVPAAAATAPLALARTEVGELDALATGCAAFGSRDVALLVDGRAFDEWTPGLRSCGIPTAGIRAAVNSRPTSPPAVRARAATEVTATARRVVAAGHLPVLVATDPAALDLPGFGPPALVVSLTTRQDEQLLEHRPRSTAPLPVSLWLSRLATPHSP